MNAEINIEMVYLVIPISKILLCNFKIFSSHTNPMFESQKGIFMLTLNVRNLQPQMNLKTHMCVKGSGTCVYL